MNTTKQHPPRITLLGNNSGRNLGDAAILSSLLDSLSRAVPDIEFYVPSIAPKWIRSSYGSQYRVIALDAMPWTGSIRLLGIPTLWAIAKSDAALICDGIIFGTRFFNPTFNYLITLVFLAPWAALCGTKLVCCSCGIGPFPTAISKLAARWVINLSDLVQMRDRDSEKLAREIGVTKPIEVTGDAAFINPVASEERAAEIAQQEGINLAAPILGINVTRYIDAWLRADERVQSRESFLQSLINGMQHAVEQFDTRPEIIVFSTQPMDEEISRKVSEGLGAHLITNSTYLSHDIQALMRHCELLVGMRFHSLVLASAVGVPVVGLVYAPKVRGFMRLIGCEDLAIELSDVSESTMREQLHRAWTERKALRERQQPVVNHFKEGAHQSIQTIAQRYFGAQ